MQKILANNLYIVYNERNNTNERTPKGERWNK